jgi:hypothetical protein
MVLKIIAYGLLVFVLVHVILFLLVCLCYLALGYTGKIHRVFDFVFAASEFIKRYYRLLRRNIRRRYFR